MTRLDAIKQRLAAATQKAKHYSLTTKEEEFARMRAREEFRFHAPDDLAYLLDAVETMREYLVEIAKPSTEVESWMETAKFRKQLAREALAKIEGMK